MSEQVNDALEANFFAAIKRGDVKEVQALVAANPQLLHSRDYTNFGGTPLNIVVFKRDREMIDALLALGAHPDDQSDWWAGPWNAVQSALQAGHFDLAEHFVEHGASIGVHEAAGLSRISELTARLDESPEKVHQRGGDGCMPLHFAGSTAVVDLLVERGADLDARDVDHYSTPAQYLAKIRPDVTRHLFRLGAQADIFSAVLSNDYELVRQMAIRDPNVFELRINQETFPPGREHDVHNIMTFTVGMNSAPLHAAASTDRLEMIDVLLETGIDVNIRGGYDESTALHVAAWNDSLDVAAKLIAAGADSDALSGEIHENSPAGWAIVAGSADVFCFLMDHGAKILDFFQEDARAGMDGRFHEYKTVDPANYRRILDRLTQ